MNIGQCLPWQFPKVDIKSEKRQFFNRFQNNKIDPHMVAQDLDSMPLNMAPGVLDIDLRELVIGLSLGIITK